MILTPTPDEALAVGPGSSLTQAEAIRLFAEVQPDIPCLAATRLLPFTACSVWLFKYIKGRVIGISEPVFTQLIRRLKDSRLPGLLDSTLKNWEDKDKALVGFDIVFCDGFKVTWTGIDVFFNVVTLKTTDFVQPPPLEKLGLDATVLFRRGMTQVLKNREEAKDGNPRDTGEAGTGSPSQGSP